MPQGVRKGFFYSSIGQIVSAVFVFSFQIILGRRLSAADYGLLNVLYSLVLSFSVILNAGPRDVLIRNVSYFLAQDKKHNAGYVIKLSYIFYTLFSIGFIIITIIFSNWIKGRFFDHSSLLFIQFLTGTILFALFRLTLSLTEAYREFHFYAFFNILFAFLLFLGMSLTILLTENVVEWIGWTIALSPILPIIFSVIVGLKKEWFPKPIKVRISGIVSLFLSLSIINFLDMFIFRSGSLVLKLYGGSSGNTLAGLFNYVYVPVSAIRTIMIALFASIFPNISKSLGEKDYRQARHYVKRGLQFVLIVSSLLTTFFLLAGVYVLKIFYGKTGGMGRADFFYISLFISFLLLGRLGNRILIALGKSKYTLISLFLGLLIIFALPAFFRNNLLRGAEFSLLLGASIYSIIEFIFISLFLRRLPIGDKKAYYE